MLIFLITPLTAFAENKVICGDGLIQDNSTGQCIPMCGEGTIPDGDNGCIIESEVIDLGQIEVIAGGIIVGVFATAFGIIWTIISRRSEIKKENLELIKGYGDKLSEIIQEEQNLETKLDCSLYAERYLDSLEQISSLLDKGLIRRDVLDYFENHFKYGMNLWYWYKENIEKISQNLLDSEFSKGVTSWSQWVKENKGSPSDFANEKKESESDRWYYFRYWCCRDEYQGRPKEPYKKFEPTPREKLVKKRLESLRAKNVITPNEEKQIKILKKLDELFEKEQNPVEDQQIFESIKNIADSDTNSEFSPFVFVKRYSKKEQYDILPDTMQEDFDDIPNENGMSKFEVVQTIQKFGEILNNIASKEKDLYSKLDCSLYVEQYLDTLEQIASLYHNLVIPKKAADFFENKFAYGINLLNWYNEKVNEKNEFEKFEPDKEEMTMQEDKEERWRDFKWFCRGGELKKNKITEFEDKEKKILPDLMYEYDSLPNEDGLKPSEVLEMIQRYSKTLTELSDKETLLSSRINCSVYVEQYLDTLEQIAYLFNKKVIVTEAVTYFENNFAYGRTLKKWYDSTVLGAKLQDKRWAEFEHYCDTFRDENKHTKKIEPFDFDATLPPAMLNYGQLDPDNNKIKYKKI